MKVVGGAEAKCEWTSDRQLTILLGKEADLGTHSCRPGACAAQATVQTLFMRGDVLDPMNVPEDPMVFVSNSEVLPSSTETQLKA